MQEFQDLYQGLASFREDVEFPRIEEYEKCVASGALTPQCFFGLLLKAGQLQVCFNLVSDINIDLEIAYGRSAIAPSYRKAKLLQLRALYKEMGEMFRRNPFDLVNFEESSLGKRHRTSELPFSGSTAMAAQKTAEDTCSTGVSIPEELEREFLKNNYGEMATEDDLEHLRSCPDPSQVDRDRFSESARYYLPTISRNLQEFRGIVARDLAMPFSTAIATVANTIALGGAIAQQIERVKRYISQENDLFSEQLLVDNIDIERWLALFHLDLAFFSARAFPDLFGKLGAYHPDVQADGGAIELANLVYNSQKNLDVLTSLASKNVLFVFALSMADTIVTTIADAPPYQSGNDPFAIRRKRKALQLACDRAEIDKEIIEMFATHACQCLGEEPGAIDKILP